MHSISNFSNYSNATLKEFELLDSKLQPSAPLIFALTGDMSTESVDRILKANFSRVYDRIGIAESKKIVQEIIDRKTARETIFLEQINSLSIS